MNESPPPAGAGPYAGQDFIRAIIAADLAAGRHATIVTRFPPEPNGYLHIGHAKAICLNFGVAGEVAGARCHLRFDDTNPTTEDVRYVEAIEADVRWLGFDWGKHLYFASDYFEQMYDFAEELIGKGLAYVDSLDEAQIREHRGTVTRAGTPSPYRDRSVAENLDLFRRMRAGEFSDGAHVLRARIDMTARNMLLRDPLLYRIRHAHHYRTGAAWCIYPLYDYAHPIEDALEHVTHSLCTLEFENNRELYDWLVANVSVPSTPRQIEFARLNLDYTVMSKRKLLQLVDSGAVTGWDDPRMPTIAGLRRRGVTPAAIRAFCDMIGVARADSRIDIGKLDYAIRSDLNVRAPRVLCVADPLRVVITNYPEHESETFDVPHWPHDVPHEGSRPVPFARELFIERADFMEDPPADFHRLAPGREVRLRHAYVIRCDDIVRDAAGAIVELRCSYDATTRGGSAPAERAVKGTIHWVAAAHALPCELRLYDRLFGVADPDAAAADSGRDFRTFLNPDSLVIRRGARIEPSVAAAPPGTRYQFERLGYFISDVVDSRADALVYNRTVTLRDTWAKQRQQDARPAAAAARPKAAARPAAAARRAPAGTDAAEAAELRALRASFVADHGVEPADAELLTRDAASARFFAAALRAAHGPTAAGDDSRGTARPGLTRSLAKWAIHELPRVAAGRPVAALPFTAAQFAELVTLLDADALSSSAAREVLAELAAHGGSPAEIVAARGLRQVSDDAELAPVAEQVIAAYPDKVAAYRAGKTGLLGFFIGQVMGRTGGRANPERVKALLEALLG